MKVIALYETMVIENYETMQRFRIKKENLKKTRPETSRRFQEDYKEIYI